LRISANYPRLDGAVSAWPVYAAFAQAVYEGLDENTVRAFVDCTNTVDAYKRLADGVVDIFFGLAPSQGQRGYAASKGAALAEMPIGRDAFVFFVHKDNPVRSLTREQIRAVYSGRVTNWKALGGPDERIMAFQRLEGSGSQTTMIGTVMQGQALRKPQREEIFKGMAGIVSGVAAYRNRRNALGYSFRWYATRLYTHPDIRLLAIDGIEPTPENIRSAAYPFTVPLLAVTARPLSPQGKSLLDWITGPEGQELLERIGYAPLP
jgi:phosphate transport system substrate-binding protein